MEFRFRFAGYTDYIGAVRTKMKLFQSFSMLTSNSNLIEIGRVVLEIKNVGRQKNKTCLFHEFLLNSAKAL